MKGIIDIHSHYGLEEETDHYKIPSWSIEKLFGFMERQDIQSTVLSSDINYSIDDKKYLAERSRALNEEGASYQQKYPDNIKFAAIVPLAYPDEAITEAVYALDTLGAAAIKVNSNSKGLYLGNELFYPVYEELNKREAILILHPAAPQLLPDGCITADHPTMFEYVADITRSVLDMILKGVLNKYPRLKIIVPHAGSFLPVVLDRAISFVNIANRGKMEPVDKQFVLEHLWFDTACTSTMAGIKNLLNMTSSSRIMFGSDFTPVPEQMSSNMIKTMKESEELSDIFDDIMHNNAKHLFKW